MNNKLSIFQKILFLELRPWSNRDYTDAKFVELRLQVKKEYNTNQPLYQVDFPKPLTNKRKYYHEVIENEAIRYLNEFHNEISQSLNDLEIKYLVNTTLTKSLNQKLNETARVIDEDQYFFNNITLPARSQANQNLSDESYILQFLKFQLIRIYLEIQESYSEFLKDDKLSEEDLHQIHFTESAPEKSFFKEAEKMQIKSTVATLIKKPALKPFTPLKNDVRPDKKGILSYNTVIKNPDRFARFEEELHDHELIDSNFNFLNRHTQKQELSAIYQTLIKKGYFKKRDFQNLKDIKHLDIRKFLDHRYSADLDKQFRIWENDPDGLANFVQNKYWIDHLPTC